MPEKPLTEDPAEIDTWKWSVRKAKKINRERHALRCDVELKISVCFCSFLSLSDYFVTSDIQVYGKC